LKLLEVTSYIGLFKFKVSFRASILLKHSNRRYTKNPPILCNIGGLILLILWMLTITFTPIFIFNILVFFGRKLSSKLKIPSSK